MVGGRLRPVSQPRRPAPQPTSGRRSSPDYHQILRGPLTGPTDSTWIAPNSSPRVQPSGTPSSNVVGSGPSPSPPFATRLLVGPCALAVARRATSVREILTLPWPLRLEFDAAGQSVVLGGRRSSRDKFLHPPMSFDLSNPAGLLTKCNEKRGCGKCDLRSSTGDRLGLCGTKLFCKAGPKATRIDHREMLKHP